MRALLHHLLRASDLHRGPVARSPDIRILFPADEPGLHRARTQTIMPRRRSVRLSEWVLAAYFSYVTALAWIFAAPGVRVQTLAVNGLLLCVYGLLLGPARSRNSLAAQHLRNWIPLGL